MQNEAASRCLLFVVFSLQIFGLTLWFSAPHFIFFGSVEEGGWVVVNHPVPQFTLVILPLQPLLLFILFALD